MELVQGTTLGDRLRAGPLPLPEAIRSAIELSQALHEAHRVGIVHRDLKPANVMVTSGGVKLLDFGVAKRVPAGTGRTGETMAAAATRPGTVLGTLPTWLPEQLRGAATDARTTCSRSVASSSKWSPVAGPSTPTPTRVIASSSPDRRLPSCSIAPRRHHFSTGSSPGALKSGLRIGGRPRSTWRRNWNGSPTSPDSASPTPARRAAPAVSRLGIEDFRSADGAVIAAARGVYGSAALRRAIDGRYNSGLLGGLCRGVSVHQIITFDRRGSGGLGVAADAQASRQAGRRIWLVEEPRRRPLSRPGFYATSAILAVSDRVEVAEDVCPGCVLYPRPASGQDADGCAAGFWPARPPVRAGRPSPGRPAIWPRPRGCRRGEAPRPALNHAVPGIGIDPLFDRLSNGSQEHAADGRVRQKLGIGFRAREQYVEQ